MPTDSLFDRYYYVRPDFVDGTSLFHRLCREAMPARGRILEVGAGPSNPTTRFLAKNWSVTGVDVSDEIRANDALAEAHVYDGGTLPFADDTFAGCASNYVLEHLADPDAHFREVLRVLRPGARYVFRTPNLRHYVALASRLTPHRLHVGLANRLRGMNEAHDPWPTHYHANTRGRIERLAFEAGFASVRFKMVEPDPSYGRIGAWAFYPMMLYERIVNATALGEPFRANILGTARK